MLHKLTHPFETHTYLIIMLYVLRKKSIKDGRRRTAGHP